MVKKVIKKKKILNPEAEAARYMKEIPDDPQKLKDLERIARETDATERKDIVGEKSMPE